jgi:hypothetical protein
VVAEAAQDDSIGGFIGRILKGLTSDQPSSSSSSVLPATQHRPTARQTAPRNHFGGEEQRD